MAAVMGMCVSYLVYIIFGQYFGAYRLNEALGREVFAIEGYAPGLQAWVHYCLLPVLINIFVAMGYDTRFYRAVMVEESSKDYITTARAKGATRKKIMFVHMLKNAMIPIVTRIMITVPFMVTGSLLVEMYFNIPGMGRTLITAIRSYDFPVIQSFTAMFAALFIVTNILTDVLYALVDPRVRLS
jgi:peptide/nickel transport system permease protein